MTRTMQATEFKARCLEVMDQVARTGESVTVTKRGRPVVRVAPVVRRPTTLRGFMKGRVRSTGDVVSPTGVEWEVERS